MNTSYSTVAKDEGHCRRSTSLFFIAWMSKLLFRFSSMQSFRFHPALRVVRATFGSRRSANSRLASNSVRQHVLISARRLRKTLAAFLASLDALFARRRNMICLTKRRFVYVSPLKALSNDIRKICRNALRIRALLSETTVATSTCVRKCAPANHCRATEGSDQKPPHILVTTPESLYSTAHVGIRPGMLRTARSLSSMRFTP